jgi:hypothetical protein
MKTTITQSDFVSAFKGNSERKDQFSYGALCALFDYYEQMEQDTGEELELDVVAICCDWTEYATALEAAQAYGWETDEPQDERSDTSEKHALVFLGDNTQVIELPVGVVVLNF